MTLKQRILSEIQKFRDPGSPISGRALAEMFELPDSCYIREIIHELRVEDDKIEILANGKGYWWSDDPEDWRAYYEKSLHPRARQFYEVEQAYLKRLKQTGEQMQLTLK